MTILVAILALIGLFILVFYISSQSACYSEMNYLKYLNIILVLLYIILIVGVII